MTRALALALALGGCIHDDYTCATDADCNLGTGGRCEADHHCTEYDQTCPSQHRYTAHSGAETATCFDDSTAIVDLCAAGQPPAQSIDCAQTVCTAIPACCQTGWSEACVREAQRTCAPTCDTRIAITAIKGALVELWDLRWDGSTWTASAAPYKTIVAWLAPPPGGSEPRLAGFVDPPSTFEVATDAGPIDFALGATNIYRGANAVDFDRDAHDTAALAYATPTGGDFVEIIKLDQPAVAPRELQVTVTNDEVWADYDHDSFPDAVAALGAGYTYLVNIDDGTDHARAIDSSVSTAFGGSATANEPSSRAFDFSDLDGNGTLDLSAYGNSMRVNLSTDRITDRALFNIDCDPPAVNPTLLPTTGGCDSTLATFAGAPLPSTGVPGLLVLSTAPTRGVYETTIQPTAVPPATTPTPLAIAPATCGASPCQPILAIATRDLDGDRNLDIIGIDGDLHVFVALSTSPSFPTLVQVTPDPIGTLNTAFREIRVSVSGAPR